MSKFIITGFADEIDPSLQIQMDALEKLGIRHIEMRGVNGKNIADCTLDETREIKRQLDSRGFSISAVGSPIGKIMITDPMAPHLDKFRHVVEIAKLLGTSYIRMFSFFIPEGDEPSRYRKEVLERLGQMCRVAEENQIILLHENEKGIYGDTTERCLDLLQSIHSPHLRMTFDPANFIQTGARPYPDAWRLLAPYVDYMHIKDALFADKSVVPAGQGDGGLPQLIEALDKKGYSGFLSLEPHLGDFVGFSSLEKDAIQKSSQEKGEVLFTIAYQALRKILDEKGC